jgi:hypothetical protein
MRCRSYLRGNADVAAALRQGLMMPGNTVDTNVNISISQQVPPGHPSNNGGGNVITLAGDCVARADGRRQDKS